jgi:hypothetical protein
VALLHFFFFFFFFIWHARKMTTSLASKKLQIEFIFATKSEKKLTQQKVGKCTMRMS